MSLRIFTHPWHIAHQYELFKLPDTEWGLWTGTSKCWKGQSRPRPSNAIDVSRVQGGTFDLAVIMLDQDSGVVGHPKRKIAVEMLVESYDLPKIVINTGSPVLDESEGERCMVDTIRHLCRDSHCVYNSHQAMREWGLMGLSQRTIIHGMDPMEFRPQSGPLDFDLVTVIPPSSRNRYYNRGYFNQMRDAMRADGLRHLWIGEKSLFSDFMEFKTALSSAVAYFNPTAHAPMPRARTEAMLMGLPCFTLGNHGADHFINDDNGWILSGNVVEDAALIKQAFHKYDACGKNRFAVREISSRLFSKERYQLEWMELLKTVVG